MDYLREFCVLVLIILKVQLLSAQSCSTTNIDDQCFDFDYTDYDCLLPSQDKIYKICEAITQYTEVYLNSYYHYKVLLLTYSDIGIVVRNFFKLANEVRLDKLYLNNTHIEEIDRGGFNYLNQLYYLNIAENSITQLYGGTFKGLDKLQYLNLSHNLISSLHVGIFSDIKLIQTIDLSYNSLSNIDNEIFHNNNNLTNVNIMKNFLTVLHNDTFKGSPNIQHLKLRYNAISAIEQGAFFYLNSIKEIDLSYNNLSEISANVFGNLDNLCILNASRNNIVTLNISENTNIFSNCYGAIFDVSYNRLLHLDCWIFEGKKLQSLRVNNNYITFNDINLDISTVEHCDFSYNIELNSVLVNNNRELKLQYTVIKNNVMFGDVISDLDLTSTMIPMDLTTFINSTALKLLLLNNNNLTYIDEDVFESQVNLIHLSLRNNSLSSVATGLFRNLYYLERLDLNDNNLSHLEIGIFSNQENLKELDLGKNNLKQLEVGILYNLHNIQYINLTNNLLSFLNFEDLVRHIIRQTNTNKILVGLDNNYWSCSWLMQILSLAQKNNFIVQKGSSFKISNVKGIGCRNNNTSLNIFSQKPKQNTRILHLLTSPTIVLPTTIQPKPEKTSINLENLLEMNVEDTTRVSVDVNLTKTEPYASPQPIDNKPPRVFIENNDPRQEKLVSFDEIKNNLNEIQESLKKNQNNSNSENRALFTFIIILLCICIIMLLLFYFTVAKNMKSSIASKDKNFQSCKMELIDDCTNDDDET